jgi:hypothetical protein
VPQLAAALLQFDSGAAQQDHPTDAAVQEAFEIGVG